MAGSLSTSTLPLTCLICTSRSETTSAATWARSTFSNFCPLVVTRERASRSVDQRLHSGRGIVHALQAIAAVFVEFFGLFQQQAIAEGADFSQRLLQVVRGHVGELLQFAVRAFQFGRIAGLLGFGLFPGADIAEKETHHRCALFLADGHGHFGGKTFAVCPDRGHFHPLSQATSLRRRLDIVRCAPVRLLPCWAKTARRWASCR